MKTHDMNKTIQYLLQYPLQYLLIICCLSILILNGCSTHSTHKTHHNQNSSDIQEYFQTYITRLDRPERDTYQKPEQVLATLHLSSPMVVADLGSGSGYFTRRFAKALYPDGKVYAIDVEEQMLNYVKNSVSGNGPFAEISYQLVKPDTLSLPEGTVDLMFLCNVYHHLDERTAYFSEAQKTLKEGGRVVIIDFYHDHRSGKIGFPRHHLISKDTVLQEMREAGFMLAKEHAFLDRQYFLEFIQQSQ